MKNQKIKTPLYSFPWLAFIFLAFSSSPLLAKPTQDTPPRPNVLWIYLEDVNGWFSCYGDTLIETPHIDSLAEAGTRFTRFYTPAGICSATRSSVITGMMQTSIGAHNHHSHRPEKWGNDLRDRYEKNILPKGVTPLPILFRNAGYWTFNDGSKNDFNFEWQGEELFDFNEGGYWDWGKVPWGPRRFCSGQALKGKPEGQPFFGQIQLGGGKNAKASAKVTDPASVTVPPYLPDLPEIRTQIARHYDCLLQTDKEVGQILAELERLKLRESTTILLFSDHGMNLPRHKEWLYEGAIRMPFIAAGPNIQIGSVRNDLISGIDIAATSLAAAGLAIPEKMEGRNIFQANYQQRDYVVAARDRCVYNVDRVRTIVSQRFKYIRNYYPDRPYTAPHYGDQKPVYAALKQWMQTAKMSPAKKAFFGAERPSEELYDLQEDPAELTNLATNPNYAKQLKQHQTWLEEWITATDDQGQYPESKRELLLEYEHFKEKCVSPEFEQFKVSN